MPTAIVIDSSVFLSWLLPEEIYKEVAMQFLRTHIEAGTILRVPTLIDYEVANVVRSAVLSKRYSSEDANATISLYRSIPIEREPFGGLFNDALSLSIAYGSSIYDAAFVATARKYRCLFYTFDKKLAKKFAMPDIVRYLMEK